MDSSTLRDAIKASGRSIAAIARDASVPATTLYSFFSGETRSMRADTFAKVAAVLEKTPSGPSAVREEQKTFSSRTDALKGQVEMARVPISPVYGVPEDILELARSYGLDVDALFDAGGIDAFRAAFKTAYAEANREAIEWTRDYVRKYGTPSQQLGMI